MLNYSDEQIKEKLNLILNRTDFTIEPMGNHHLKRHLVYRIDFLNEKSLTFKLSFIVENCSWAHWQAPDYYKENISFLRRLL